MVTKKKAEIDSKNVKSKQKIKFEFSAPDATEVFLAGDFNQWNTQATPMKKDKKGKWQATVSLEPARYEYRLLVDGHWEDDPSCSDCVANEFGGQNCVRIVT